MSRPFRFGIVAARAQSGDDWIALARRAEELGYSTLLVPDRIGPVLSPLPALAIAAGATRTLRLGTFVLANGLRSPALLAREIATLDYLSGGRFELGIGTGVSENDFVQAGVPYGSPGARVERLAATVSTLKTLLTGHDADGATSASVGHGYPPPVQQPHPPMLIAAGGRRVVELAAREADVVALATGPDASERDLEVRIDWLRHSAGERFERIELSLNLLAVVGDATAPQWLRDRIRAVSRLDLDRLVQDKSPFVAVGSDEQICEELRDLRARLGISYVTLSSDLMESFAPVVAKLTET